MSQPRSDIRPDLGPLIGGVILDLKDLFAGELKLARSELDHKLRKLILAAVLIVGGAFVAFAGLIVLLEGVAAVLALVVPAWAAWLIVGAAIVAGAALLARIGIAMLSVKTMASSRTWSNLQRDARTIREHV